MISVHETEKLSLQQIEQFLLAAKEVRFEASQREEIYGWVERLLCQQEYMGQGRRARGLLRRYLGKMTGLSRAQLTRLVGRYLATGRVRIKTSHRHRFPTRYTRADIELLAQVDEAHETLSGPATRRIFEREFGHYGKLEFQRLAAISNGHLYNLRRTPRAIASASRITKKRGPAQWPLASAAVPIREGAPGICGWIRCTKATPNMPGASTTSTPWMRSRNGKLWRRCRASRKRIWNRCSSWCWPSFPLSFTAFTPTMAVSLSIRP